MKIHYTIFQQVKDISNPLYTEDCYTCSSCSNPELGKEYICSLTSSPIKYILSDGASESFDSKNWSELLIKKLKSHLWNFFTQKKSLSSILSTTYNEYASMYNIKNLTWSKAQAFEKGSFATLLACCIKNDFAHILAIGDSTAFFITNNKILQPESFPYSCEEEFFQKPLLISSKPYHNNFINDQNFFNTHTKLWKILPGSTILLMTDALALWTIQHKNNHAFSKLLAIQSNHEFSDFILQQRLNKKINTDDTTLIKITFN